MLAKITLPPDHQLTVAGLQHVRIVRQLEVGAKPGDVIFQFPHGKMVLEKDKNGMLKMPRSENIVPPGINKGVVLKEAIMAQSKDRRCNQ